MWAQVFTFEVEFSGTSKKYRKAIISEDKNNAWIQAVDHFSRCGPSSIRTVNLVCTQDLTQEENETLKKIIEVNGAE